MKRKNLLSIGALALSLSLCSCGGGSTIKPETQAQESENKDITQESKDPGIAEPSFADSTTKEDNDNIAEVTNEGNETDTEDNESAEREAYYKKASAIYQKAEVLLNALKEGDIETVVALGDSRDDITKALENATDSESAKKLMQIIYADLNWEITQNDIEHLADELYNCKDSDFDDNDDMNLYFDVLSVKNMINSNKLALTYFEPGTIVMEDYIPESEEEAIRILEYILSITPNVFYPSLNITFPDDEGNFRFLYEDTSFIEYSGIKYLGWGYEENKASFYISKLMDVISDFTINDEDAVYEEYNDIYTEAISLLLNKDFEKFTDLVEKDPCECDYREKLGTYQELTDAQKSFVDDYINNTNIVHVDFSWIHADGTKARDGLIMVDYPYIDSFPNASEEYITENNIRKSSVFYLSSSSIKTLDNLAYCYYNAILYAKRNL